MMLKALLIVTLDIRPRNNAMPILAREKIFALVGAFFVYQFTQFVVLKLP